MHASEYRAYVIGLGVRIYTRMYKVIWRFTSPQIVETSSNINSPSAGRNSGDSINFLPYINHLPFLATPTTQSLLDYTWQIYLVSSFSWVPWAQGQGPVFYQALVL